MQASLETGWIYYLLGIAAFSLIVSGTYIFLFRGGRSHALKNAPQFPRYGSRVSLIEDYPLGYDQKLVLIRRDHVEHLLFVSPEAVSVIETGIPFSHESSHDPLVKRQRQGDGAHLRPQHDLFTPPSVDPLPNVLPFSEHVHTTASHSKSAHNFSMPLSQKDHNVSIASQDFGHFHLNHALSEKGIQGSTASFMPMHASEKSPLPASLPQEPDYQEEHSLTEPLERELEKLHGKVEKLTSLPLTHNQFSECAPSRVPPHTHGPYVDSHREHGHFLTQPQNSISSDAKPSFSQLASPFSSTPMHYSEPPEIISEPPPFNELPLLPALNTFSETDAPSHKDILPYSTTPSESLHHPKLPVEKTSSESLVQGKSGVSLQEIEEEFARLLGNRPPI